MSKESPSAETKLRVIPPSKPERPFPLGNLISHDLRMAWRNIKQRYTAPYGNYDHWRSARRFIWSALSRPYWHWRTRHDFR